MIIYRIIRFLGYFTIFIVFGILSCKSTYELTFDKLDSTLIMYSRYRVISNNLIAFKKKDQISKEKTASIDKYYKVFYNPDGVIAVIETYHNNIIVKRRYLNRLSLSVKIELFKKGIMDKYYILVYEKSFLEDLDNLRNDNKNIFAERYLTYNLDRVKKYDKHYKLKWVKWYGYGSIEEMDYYLNGKKYKTETYVAGKVDMTRLFNDKGNVFLEKGTYENGKHPFSLKYFYKKDILLKIEDYRKGRLYAIFYYNENRVNIKEERYKLGKLVKTIKYNN